MERLEREEVTRMRPIMHRLREIREPDKALGPNDCVHHLLASP